MEKEISKPIILPIKKFLYLILLPIRILLTCIWIDKLPKTIKNKIKQALIVIFEIKIVEKVPLVKSNKPQIITYKYLSHIKVFVIIQDIK